MGHLTKLITQSKIEHANFLKIFFRPFRNVEVRWNGEHLEQVTDFKYLVSILHEEGRCTQEIKTRIAMAKCTFNSRRELLTKGLSLNLRKRMVKSLVWSVLLYGAETWTLCKEDIKSLEACEM